MLDRSSSSSGTGRVSGQTPIEGFTGGALQLVAAPLQLPLTVLKTSVQKNIVYGATIGTVAGVTRGVGDVVGGTTRMLSNAIPSNPLELVSRKMAYINAAQ